VTVKQVEESKEIVSAEKDEEAFAASAGPTGLKR
jgi:hypothetical protein